MLLCAAFFTLHSSLFTSCSESDDEDADEYANWKVRNDAYFLSLEDSLKRTDANWKKIKSYTKDATTVGSNTDYIYVKELQQGTGTQSPLFTDSVRLSYRGRLIPSVTYPEGYVFDQTYIGDYSIRTTAVTDNLASGFITGFTTALIHMHQGDRWRIFIPYQLGYGTSASGSIPAYSTLIFDVQLIDFLPEKGAFAPWSSRQR